MNIILEGPDATGKSTLSKKLKDKYGMNIINSTSHTRNDFSYHIDLLNTCENSIFERFHIGEVVYPEIYKREGKITNDEFIKITKRIVDNNDILIVFYTSDVELLEKRLIERGEFEYLKEIKQQNQLFIKWIYVIGAFEYKNFYAIDISEKDSYEKLDKWIDNHYNKKTFNIQYRQLCRDLLENGHEVKMPNANRGSSFELNNYMFVVDDLDNEILTLKTRKNSYEYLAGETLWYWLSRNDLDFISKFSSFWKRLSDDGETCNSAYGYILEEKFYFNQIEKIIELLKNDKNSRRAILNINVPNAKVIETKDEPCTICLDFIIRDNKLDCTCVMRSNDIIFGLTYDFTYFVQLQKYIASRLNIQYGKYTHFAMSIHFYDRDMQLVKNIAYGDTETDEYSLDLDELMKHKYKLSNYIDNEWTNKEEFTKLLKSKNIIRRK